MLQVNRGSTAQALAIDEALKERHAALKSSQSQAPGVEEGATHMAHRDALSGKRPRSESEEGDRDSGGAERKMLDGQHDGQDGGEDDDEDDDDDDGDFEGDFDGEGAEDADSVKMFDAARGSSIGDSGSSSHTNSKDKRKKGKKKNGKFQGRKSVVEQEMGGQQVGDQLGSARLNSVRMKLSPIHYRPHTHRPYTIAHMLSPYSRSICGRWAS